MICHPSPFGGNLFCAYKYPTVKFPFGPQQGTTEIWGVGTNFSVWTRWQNPQGGLSSWVNQGGSVKHSYSSHDFQVINCADVYVGYVDPDGHGHWNIRSITSGTWSGWRTNVAVPC